jgi:hypothetical protein
MILTLRRKARREKLRGGTVELSTLKFKRANDDPERGIKSRTVTVLGQDVSAADREDEIWSQIAELGEDDHDDYEDDAESRIPASDDWLDEFRTRYYDLQDELQGRAS